MASDFKIPTFGAREPGLLYIDRPGAYALIENGSGLLALLKTSFGVFLPGGGLDPGEDEIAGLKRELWEEMAALIISHEFLGRAAQYLYSRHYQKHFRKIGGFYQVELSRMDELRMDETHELLWLNRSEAVLTLSEEFQRWAVGEFTKKERRT